MKVSCDFSSLSFTKVVLVILCFFILSAFIYFSVAANFDLSAGRFALFMDERITFDGVKKILYPDGLLSFVESIVKGDQRYGRSLWISMAAFAFIPEQIWGESGQIIAGRMLQVFLIASSWFIFAFGILRNWYLRVVLLVAVLAMPYSDYYMSMPKPEPLQIFFLAVFCFFYLRNKLAFGWYWVFAGLAFGTKISTFPAVIVFGLAALFANHKLGRGAGIWQSLKFPILSFSLGLAIAVPILLIPVLFGAGGYYFYGKLKSRYRISVISRGVMIAIGLVIFYVLSGNVVREWLNQTFFNTKHGADQASVNVWTWISFYFEKWLIVPEVVGITFFILSFLFVCFFGILYFWKRDISPKNIAALSMTFSGIALNFAIFFGAQRLWGFYLYPGTILMVTGLIFMIDLSLSDESVNQSGFFNRSTRVLGYAVAFFLFCIATFAWAPYAINNLEVLALRTKSEDYIQQYASYQEVTKFLDNQAEIKNGPLIVMLTPSLFPPESNDKYKIVEFWGPYIQWDQSPDVIVFGSINTPRGTLTPFDSPSYSDFISERVGYIKHVADKISNCKADPCFVRNSMLQNGGEILVLADRNYRQ